MNSINKFLLSIIVTVVSSMGHAEIMLNDVNGQNTPFTALKGKWVLINYWAGWCQTCVDEIPEFNRFNERHKNKGIALFGVNYDALPVFEQKSLIKRLNITYSSLAIDPGSELRLGDIAGVPVTFIFNPQGQLVETLYGGQTADNLDRIINKLKAA